MRPILARLSKSQLYNWMQDSVVVDENDNPLMVYHTTNKEFQRFSKKKLGLETLDNASQLGYALTALTGIWFSTNHFENSDWNKYVIGAYLKITNPLEYYTQHDLADDLGVFVYDEYGLEDIEYGRKAQLLYKRCVNDWVNQQKYYGYDGIVIEKDTEYKGTSFVVFDSSQIRIVKRFKY